MLIHIELTRVARRHEWTFTLTFASGATQVLVIEAWGYADARAEIMNRYGF